MLLKNEPVYIEGCTAYRQDEIKALLARAIDALGFEEHIRGKRVVVKPNLVRKMDPERGGTTHPVMLEALCRLLFERGARSVLIAESPGGCTIPPPLAVFTAGAALPRRQRARGRS